MDRIIEVKVGGNHLSKDSKNAGVRGEANVTKLRITFDKGWEAYSKKVTFWNTRGLNPVVVYLLPHMAEDPHTYIVPIPKEPMEEAGMFTFVIDGEFGNMVQRSLSDKLEVKDAPIADNAGKPVPPTPDALTQLEGEIELIKDDILAAKKAKEDIDNMTVSAETLETGEEAFVVKDDKNNLHFGLPVGDKGDTGDSGVYIGEEEPTDPKVNVWIDTDADGGGGYVLTASDKAEIAQIMNEYLVSLSAEEDAEKTITLTASGWVGSSAPYSQTVNVDGIDTNTQGAVFVAESATDEQYNAAVYAILRKTAQGTNSITIKAYGEKPTIDIPLTLRIGG